MRRRDSTAARHAFSRVRLSERAYFRQLAKVARRIIDIIRGYEDDILDKKTTAVVTSLLERYAQFIAPWTRAAAKRMAAETARRDTTAREQYADVMGKEFSARCVSATRARELASFAASGKRRRPTCAPIARRCRRAGSPTRRDAACRAGG